MNEISVGHRQELLDALYGFRPLAGDVVARFRQTLSRELIAPQYQELQLASAPVFSGISIPGPMPRTSRSSAKPARSV